MAVMLMVVSQISWYVSGSVARQKSTDHSCTTGSPSARKLTWQSANGQRMGVTTIPSDDPQVAPSALNYYIIYIIYIIIKWFNCTSNGQWFADDRPEGWSWSCPCSCHLWYSITGNDPPWASTILVLTPWKNRDNSGSLGHLGWPSACQIAESQSWRTFLRRCQAKKQKTLCFTTSSHLATMMVVKSHQIHARYEQSQRFSRVCCFILLNHQIRTSEWFSRIGFSEILRNSAENHGINGKSLEFHEILRLISRFWSPVDRWPTWSKPQGALARRTWRRRAADLTSSLKRDNYIADLYGMKWHEYEAKNLALFVA